MVISLLLVVLAQFTSMSDRSDLKTLLEGHWQSCSDAQGEYDEQVFDHPAIPAFEFHMGPGDEFALFKGVNGAVHIDHSDSRNLLAPSFHAAGFSTWRGKREWSAMGLNVSVVQAGGSRPNCTSFWVKVSREPIK